MAPAHRGAQLGYMVNGAESPVSHARVTQMIYSGSTDKEKRKQETWLVSGNQRDPSKLLPQSQNPYHPIGPSAYIRLGIKIILIRAIKMDRSMLYKFMQINTEANR